MWLQRRILEDVVYRYGVLSWVAHLLSHGFEEPVVNYYFSYKLRYVSAGEDKAITYTCLGKKRCLRRATKGDWKTVVAVRKLEEQQL